MSGSATKALPRLSISAFGIHIGGGLVLLRAVLAAARGRIDHVLLDDRLDRRDLPIDESTRVTSVRRSFIARARALHRLSRDTGPDDVLLCFNSLPPLQRAAARVVTFVQAAHFVGLHAGIRYPRLTALRHAIEATWLRLGARHSDEIWVQTLSVSDALKRRFPTASVQITPVVDDSLFDLLRTVAARQQADPEPSMKTEDFSFFYPADGVEHKNHRNLIEAWRRLSEGGMHPQLTLTLRPHEINLMARQIGVGKPWPDNILNVGQVDRAEVLRQMRQCSSLVFPSRAETFGLPLVEARSLDVPIIASERDFVRDVCDPVQTFDPGSARSIADAVHRFMTSTTHWSGSNARACWSAAQFVERLFA